MKTFFEDKEIINLVILDLSSNLQEGLKFEEEGVGYTELSDEFYKDPYVAVNGGIHPGEILVIMENSDYRRKEHYGYDAETEKEFGPKPVFSSPMIVGCINSDLSFTQNPEATIIVEKSVTRK